MDNSTLAWKQFSNGQTPSTIQVDPSFYTMVSPSSSVLDFGCGWGRVSLELQEKGYSVTGFDVNEAEIRRAQEFAQEANRKYKTQVRFDVADIASEQGLPYSNNSFNVGLMHAFMGVLIDPVHRIRALEEAFRVLVPGGVLYMAEFAQDLENPKCRERYEAHFPMTKERGTFIVTRDGTPKTPEIYRVHHYTLQELSDLLRPRFSKVTIKETKFRSHHGNLINGLVVFARN